MKPCRRRETGLRVLVVADHLGHPGGKRHGGTTYFLSVLPALLKEAGVKLFACFQSPRHPAADELEEAGVDAVFLGRKKWDSRALPDLLRLAQRVNPHVMHLHTWKSDILGRIAARRGRIPAIVHIHDTAPPPSVLWFLQRGLTRWTSAMVAVSESVREFAIRTYRMPPEKVHVLHNGLDLRQYAPRTASHRAVIRRALGLPEDAKVVAVTGRIVEQKGQAVLIEAMAPLLSQRDDVRLLVVGDGPQRHMCETIVAAHDLSGTVLFTGQRLDIPDVLSAVDVVAMPSLCEEGLGYSAMEAIAAGLPVVAFRSGGIPALVIDERTGLLIDKGDREALREAIERLLDDEPLRCAMGANAWKHAQQFSLDAHIDRLIEIYRSVLPQAANPAPRPTVSVPAIVRKQPASTVP